jgi:N-acyl-L-homoserine lactone synthetase
MISCITCDNLDEFGKILRSQYSLRHACFIERQHYDVSFYKGMEFDEYDTPAAAYLVYHSADGEALGASRLTPTVVSCMLRDLWPHLVEDKRNFSSPLIWEGTRYCINKDVSPDLRRRIVHEMACAYLEFGLAHGLKKIVGMMPTGIYRSVFERPGIEMEYLGDVHMIGEHKCRAVAIPTNAQQLATVRRKTGISDPVLRFTLAPEGMRPNAKAA